MDTATHHEAHRGDTAPGTMRNRLRGAVIDVAPVFGFTLSFALTHRIAVALALALAAGIGVCAYRLIHRQSVWRALGVLGVVCIGGTLAARTGQAVNFFLPGLAAQAVMAAATPVLLLFGWPPMGLAAGLITGERTRWRRCLVRRRAFARGSLVTLAGHLVVVSVELPLWVSGWTVALGSVDVFGPIVFALSAFLGWRLYRRVAGTHRCDSPTSADMSPACAPIHFTLSERTEP